MLVVGRAQGGVTGLKVTGQVGIEVGHALFTTASTLEHLHPPFTTASDSEEDEGGQFSMEES